MPGCTLELGRFSSALALSFLCLACGGADRDADGVPAGTDTPPAAGAPAGLASAAPITDQELQSFRLSEDRLRAWHRVQLAAPQQPDLRLQDDDLEDEEPMCRDRYVMWSPARKFCGIPWVGSVMSAVT